MARVGMSFRRLYCGKCRKMMHRDTMAAHNLCNIVREQLCHLRRPFYVQPRRKDGTYPWRSINNGTGNARHKRIIGPNSSELFCTRDLVAASPIRPSTFLGVGMHASVQVFVCVIVITLERRKVGDYLALRVFLRDHVRK